MVSLQQLPVAIGSISKANVDGIWSSLALELNYMTNDDDERYSIQALPNHARNICIQAADPPLGYPVYMSGLVNIPVKI